MANKVFVVGYDPQTDVMFTRHGWKIVKDIAKADLVQFTGGSDVSPKLYGQTRHSLTFCNPDRDRREAIIFSMSKKRGLPMAGICRGAQFLNVMCGGSLYQHVDNHKKEHLARYEWAGKDDSEYISVTSTHHQMMIPTKHGLEILVANVSSRKEKMSKTGTVSIFKDNSDHWSDTECVWYMEQNCLCFQPHPEYNVPHLEEFYFNKLLTLIL